MGDGPSSPDEDLLARLNALKASHVSIDSSPALLASATEKGADNTPEDLIARFQRIHGRPASGKQEQGVEAVAFSGDNRPPSPTIEELLAELGPIEEYRIDRTEVEEAQKLMAEAKSAMPDADPVSVKETTSLETSKSGAGTSTDPPPTDLDEDAEAQEALQRILNEAENEPPEESPPPKIGSAVDIGHDKPQARAAPPDSFSGLQFPSTPDSAFDSLDLPSAPTTVPTRKQKAQGKAKPPSDQEIETWCVICCNDATVRCFGCDKDLYCWSCWREGHMGEDAGLEEKRHVWERYKKPKV